MSDAEQNEETGGKMQRKKVSRGWEDDINSSLVKSHKWGQTTFVKEKDPGVIKRGRMKAWQES